MERRKGLHIIPVNQLTIARLYDTNIVEIDQVNKTLTLNDGGWLTKHTKTCINDIINNYGYWLIQRSYNWYIVDQNGTQKPYQSGMKISF